MNGVPMLRQLVHRLMTQQVGTSRGPDEVAVALVAVLSKLLASLEGLLGAGNEALLRRSVRLTEAAFPCYMEVQSADQDGLVKAVSASLRKQTPEVAWDASVALLSAYIDLLVTLIGSGLTWQLFRETWSDLTFPSEEIHS
jgi:hypothetical protein